MKKRFAAFVSTVLAAVLCACSAAPKDVLPNKAAQPTEAPTQQAQTTQAAPTEQPTPEPDLVQQLLEEMTLEQKVGQLFLVRPDSLDLSQTQDQINDAKADGVTELTDAMRQTLAEYPVGGVVIFGKNLESPQQITQFLDDLQQASDTPLFTAIDEEGAWWRALPTMPRLTCPNTKALRQWEHPVTRKMPAPWAAPLAAT